MIDTLVKYIKENIFSIVAALGSVLAMFMSIRTYNLSKREVYADVLATNRIKWVNDFRTKLGEFIEAYYSEYSKPPAKRYKLQRIKFEVESFLDYNRDNIGYDTLRNQLNLIVESPQNELISDFSKFLEVSQKVLSDAYLRAKRESGVTKRMDSKTANIINKETNQK